MSEPVHVLVVRAAGLPWALPMGSVQQTFAFGAHRVHDVAGSRVVVFRGDALEVVGLAERLGFPPAELRAGVVLWAGGQRRVFAVDELMGQLMLERCDVPSAAQGAQTSGVVLGADGEIIPVLEPGVIAGAWSPAGPASFGFSDLQRSALLEIANIGSGKAATALSQLLGKPVEIGYAEALLATLAEAADKVGAAAAPSASWTPRWPTRAARCCCSSPTAPQSSCASSSARASTTTWAAPPCARSGTSSPAPT
jgi:hypothetical protein